MSDPDAVAARWSGVLGEDPASAGVQFTAQEPDAGLVEVALGGAGSSRDPLAVGGLRFVFAR